MPYNPPTFNLFCNIVTTYTDPVQVVTEEDVQLQLKGIPRTESVEVGDDDLWSVLTTIGKFPAGTRILGRDTDDGSSEVTVNLFPPVTFLAVSVWDVACGFPNEYRAALLKRLGPLPGQERPEA